MQTIVPFVPAAPAIGQHARGNYDCDALVTAHAVTANALIGYDTLIEKAAPAFRYTAEQFRTLHLRHAARLARMLAGRGITPDATGPFGATLNGGAFAGNAVLGDNGNNLMGQIRTAEAHVLHAFNEAVVAGGSELTTWQLAEMRCELIALLDATRHVG